MITAGIDLAASPKNTGIAVLDGLRVVELRVDADDDCLVDLCRGADKIGIDCPLGWPEEFIAFITAHRDGAVTGARDTVALRESLAYRATDLHCRADRLRPLSVSADRIGHAAMRCVALLARLTDDRDRSGAGRVVETYPAGSLHRWGLKSRGYKGTPNVAALAILAGDVLSGSGLTFADETGRRLYSGSDHAFDAVVAALTARAAVHGLVDDVPIDQLDVARREGWIRLPTCSLEELAAI